jgi:hypothetical protein
MPVRPAVATASTAPADNWSLLHEDKMEAPHGSGPEQGGTFARAEDGGVASRCRRSTATLLAAQAVKDEQRAGLETEGGATGRWRSRRGTVPGFASDCAAAPARFQFAKLRKHPRSRARGFMGERSATAPIGRLTLRVRQIRRLAG